MPGLRGSSRVGFYGRRLDEVDENRFASASASKLDWRGRAGGSPGSIGDEWGQPLAWEVSGGGQRERFSEAPPVQVGARIDGGALDIQARN
jgi:hypothetical protein